MAEQKLPSTMSEKFIWALAYGSSIGWGAFVLPGDWILNSGAIGASLGILIGGLLMIIISISYGALTSRFPVSGGEFAFSYLGFGKYFSFFSSWFLILGYICIVALNASAFSLLFKFLLPQYIEKGYLYSIAGWDIYITEVILSTIILIFFAFISVKGTGLSGRLQFIFCLFMAIFVSLLFVVSFNVGEFSFSNLNPLFNDKIGVLQSILLIVSIAPWMYVGFDNIPQLAEEFNFKPEKTFKLLIFSIMAAILTYVAMILVTAWIYPDQSKIDGELWITGSVISASMGKIGMFFLSFSILMGIFTGLNGFYMSASRLIYALGRSKMIPEQFGMLHKKNNTPYLSILFIMMICLPAPWLGRTALSWIVDMSSVGVSVAFLATCLTAVKFFGKGKEKNLGFMIAGVFGAIISFFFLCLLLIPNTPSSLSQPSYIALLIWTVIGIIFFLLQYKKLNKLTKEELDAIILQK